MYLYVHVGPRTRRVVSAQSGVKSVYLSVRTVSTCSTCSCVFDCIDNCTGSSESADPDTTGGGVTSKSEGLVFVCHKCTSCVSVGPRTRRVVSAFKTGISTGSSESADPKTGGGVTSKGECLVFVESQTSQH